ncbi:MAG: hypothetical protein FWE42_04435 [Defluviitaleaceae bacterium]|nr:hypothetical protein [Defluviitaleaceae bacterium]
MNFYEIIHTRCNQGFDIEQGKNISSAGYKEYAYSSGLRREGTVDIHYLAKAMLCKPRSYTDPAFMDNAYAYHTPEAASGFCGIFLNFHPVKWNRNYTGNEFSNRPGNFINQAYVGDFVKSGFYPFELFDNRPIGGRYIWDAQRKLLPSRCHNKANEVCTRDARCETPCDLSHPCMLENYGYYYQNPPPADLPMRQFSPEDCKTNFSRLAGFVSTGNNRELLKKAVAFIIEQFKHSEHKNRKYLVIREKSDKQIQLWISAIQCAFSPRMAAAISFATRMERFEMSNRYTVNQAEQFQSKSNFQDPRQSERYHAMIVGAVEGDSSVGPIRTTPNTSFVILDGIKGTINYEANTTSGYYNAITAFDSDHEDFCRYVAQGFTSLVKPCEDIITLYSDYNYVSNSNLEASNPDALYELLNRLERLNPTLTPQFKNICTKVETSISHHLHTKPESALRIIGWLVNASGDPQVKARLDKDVYSTYTKILFEQGNIHSAESLWQVLVNIDSYAPTIAKIITDFNLLIENQAHLALLSSSDCIRFLSLYKKSTQYVKLNDVEGIRAIAYWGFCAAYQRENKNIEAAESVIDFLGGLVTNEEGFILDLASMYVGTSTADVMRHMVNVYINKAAVTASNNNMTMFFNRLHEFSLHEYAVLAMNHRLAQINSQKDFKEFLTMAAGYNTWPDFDILYQDIDKKISPLGDDKGNVELALMVLRGSDEANHDDSSGFECYNSAHAYALASTGKDLAPHALVDRYRSLGRHGFPVAISPTYHEKLAERILQIKFDKKDTSSHPDILEILAQEPKLVYLDAYILLLFKNPPRDSYERLNDILAYGKSHSNNRDFHDIMLNVLADTRSEKRLAEIRTDVSAQNVKYYDKLAAEAEEIIRSKKKPGILSSIFGRGKNKNS